MGFLGQENLSLAVPPKLTQKQRPLCSHIQQYALRLITGGVPRRGYLAGILLFALPSGVHSTGFFTLRLHRPQLASEKKAPMYSSPSSVYMRYYMPSGVVCQLLIQKFFWEFSQSGMKTGRPASSSEKPSNSVSAYADT